MYVCMYVCMYVYMNRFVCGYFFLQRRQWVLSSIMTQYREFWWAWGARDSVRGGARPRIRDGARATSVQV